MTRKVTPVKMLETTQALQNSMETAKDHAVFVGLPKEKVGGQIYGDGQSIMTIGAIHEYGGGNNPERSFLRVPFQEKESEVGGEILRQFEAVAEGRRDVKTSLGRVGARAVNIVKEAFRTGGFGKWPKLNPATVERKGFDDILEDTRVLRNSVGWVVRRDS